MAYADYVQALLCLKGHQGGEYKTISRPPMYCQITLLVRNVLLQREERHLYWQKIHEII